MSILIKGIDLPKEGEKITLAIFHDGDIVSYKYWLPKEAEAIQIPKDHGKISDITKYKKENAMQDDTCQGCPNIGKCESFAYTKMDICEWLDDIPTILEAEE